MKYFATKLTLATTFALLAIGIAISAPQLPEAPAGFDGLTNGFVAQNVMNDAAVAFMKIETPEDGLGPVYNAVSCVECHQSIAVGGATQARELRAGHTARGEHSRDDYFQEGKRRGDTNGSSPTFTAASAVLANGDVIPDRSLINQRAICADAEEHAIDEDNTRAPRLSLSVLGDGFVEAVPEATFLALAKQNRGLAIMVPVLEVPNTNEVGRFGWKDQHASLVTFSGDAFANELGESNPLFPDEVTTVCEPPNLPHPNASLSNLETFATFMRSTKVPPRGPVTAAAQQGQVIFESIGCASCHVSTLVTAPTGTSIHGGAFVIPEALGGKQFHPFGDFLLHDIGTGDGIEQDDPSQTANEIRTMPLWGLRTRTQLLHDGSAVTFSDAIDRHQNEAADESLRFKRLSSAQKQLVYQFLGSL